MYFVYGDSDVIHHEGVHKVSDQACLIRCIFKRILSKFKTRERKTALWLNTMSTLRD